MLLVLHCNIDACFLYRTVTSTILLVYKRLSITRRSQLNTLATKEKILIYLTLILGIVSRISGYTAAFKSFNVFGIKLNIYIKFCVLGQHLYKEVYFGKTFKWSFVFWDTIYINFCILGQHLFKVLFLGQHLHKFVCFGTIFI